MNLMDKYVKIKMYESLKWAEMVEIECVVTDKDNKII